MIIYDMICMKIKINYKMGCWMYMNMNGSSRILLLTLEVSEINSLYNL